MYSYIQVITHTIKYYLVRCKKLMKNYENDVFFNVVIEEKIQRKFNSIQYEAKMAVV